MGGRPPMPPERARRLGNPNHKAKEALAVPAVVEVAGPVPAAPPNLLVAGKRLWSSVHQFAGQWVNPQLDVSILLVACEIADDRERLKRTLKRDGHFQKIPLSNSRGEIIGSEIKVHPARKELRAQDAAFHRVLGSLGLTPADRARLKLTEVQAENEFDKWLKGKQ